MGKPSELIDHAGFNDVKNLFRIDIAAFRTRPRRLIGGVDDFLKINHGFHRVAVINLKPADVKDNQRIEHFKDIRRRLMDHNKDHLATKGQFFKQVHDIFRIA